MTDIDEDAGLDGRGGPYLVPGLDRGLRILMEFSPREPVLGAPELARRLEIPRTTVFRLLQTLESLGFLERVDKDRSYRLGVAVLRLGFEYLSSLELTDFGAPIIERLRDETGFTSHIVIRDGRDIVFVAKAQSYESGFSSVRVHVGTRLPAHATVHGRLLMSGLTFKELKALFPESKLQQYTERTPRTVTQLYKLIQEDIQRGFVVSESSFERGISVVTAPVRDDIGQVAAVITVTIPRAEITPRELASGLVEKVRAAADELSLRLNYRPEAISSGPSHYLKSLGL
nr:IclR family transcriptional regulator [Caballeronia novacaledonica]